jgi:hypothetical protein
MAYPESWAILAYFLLVSSGIAFMSNSADRPDITERRWALATGITFTAAATMVATVIAAAQNVAVHTIDGLIVFTGLCLVGSAYFFGLLRRPTTKLSAISALSVLLTIALGMMFFRILIRPQSSLVVPASQRNEKEKESEQNPAEPQPHSATDAQGAIVKQVIKAYVKQYKKCPPTDYVNEQLRAQGRPFTVRSFNCEVAHLPKGTAAINVDGSDIDTLEIRDNIIVEGGGGMFSGKSSRLKNVVIENNKEVPSQSAKAAPQQTTKQKALELSEAERSWFASERDKYGTDYEGWRAFMARDFPARFGAQTQEISEELKKCGADTSRLDHVIDLIMKNTDNPGVWSGVPTYLREAARDIPSGQLECGTEPVPAGTFHDKEGSYTVEMGTSATSLATDETGNESMITYFDTLKVYIIQGHPFVDATLYAGEDYPAVEIKRNEVKMEESSFDRNFNDKAIEIVEQRGIPLLQIIFEGGKRIRINGAFLSRDAKTVTIVTPDGMQKFNVDPTGNSKIAVPLKPIFKYPSWKYSGMYAEQ